MFPEWPYLVVFTPELAAPDENAPKPGFRYSSCLLATSVQWMTVVLEWSKVVRVRSASLRFESVLAWPGNQRPQQTLYLSTSHGRATCERLFTRSHNNLTVYKLVLKFTEITKSDWNYRKKIWRFPEPPWFLYRSEGRNPGCWHT